MMMMVMMMMMMMMMRLPLRADIMFLLGLDGDGTMVEVVVCAGSDGGGGGSDGFDGAVVVLLLLLLLLLLPCCRCCRCCRCCCVLPLLVVWLAMWAASKVVQRPGLQWRFFVLLFRGLWVIWYLHGACSADFEPSFQKKNPQNLAVNALLQSKGARNRMWRERQLHSS